MSIFSLNCIKNVGYIYKISCGAFQISYGLNPEISGEKTSLPYFLFLFILKNRKLQKHRKLNSWQWWERLKVSASFFHSLSSWRGICSRQLTNYCYQTANPAKVSSLLFDEETFEEDSIKKMQEWCSNKTAQQWLELITNMNSLVVDKGELFLNIVIFKCFLLPLLGSNFFFSHTTLMAGGLQNRRISLSPPSLLKMQK